MDPSNEDAFEQYLRRQQEAREIRDRESARSRSAAEIAAVGHIATAREIGLSIAQDSASVDYVVPHWEKTTITIPVEIPDDRLFKRFRRPRDELLYTRGEIRETLALNLTNGKRKAFHYVNDFANFTDDPNRVLLLPSGLIIGELSTKTIGGVLIWLNNYRTILDDYLEGTPRPRE